MIKIDQSRAYKTIFPLITFKRYQSLSSVASESLNFKKIKKKQAANRKFKNENALIFGPKISTEKAYNGLEEQKIQNTSKTNEIPFATISNFQQSSPFDISADLANYLEKNFELRDLKKDYNQNNEYLNGIVHYPISGECDSSLSYLPQNLRNKWPSVTRILDKSRSPEDQFFLDRWKEKMIEKLGRDGFAQMQKDTLERGTLLHECIEAQLQLVFLFHNCILFHYTIFRIYSIYSKCRNHVMPKEKVKKIEPLWNSIKNVMPKIGEVYMIEQFFHHQHLFYKGKADCVATLNDRACVIDWKTSEKPKKSLKNTWDAPTQISAYIGAINSQKLIKSPVTGAVIVCYTNGDEADIHLMDEAACREYWLKWVKRLHVYWKKINDENIKIDLS